MIKEIFLPEKIGNKRILSQRILGLTLHEDVVRVAVIYATGNKSFIEKLREEKIEAGSEESFPDRAVQAIKKIVLSIKAYDYIRISIPASIVIFKELQLQFSDPEKIRMVLDYEIETMIPFSMSEAIVDFIITKTKTDQATQVLVAAVRSQDLQEHLSMYEKAGIDPAHITVDLFALYGLYQQIPDYASLPNATALVEIGTTTTRVAFIQQGQLRLNRSIQRGIETVFKLISDETHIPVDEIGKKLAFNGVRAAGDEVFSRAAQKHFVLLLNDIQFTLNSFSLKLNFYDGVSKILFTGHVHAIHDFMTFCSDTMQIPCEVFDCKKVLTNKNAKNKIKDKVENWGPYSIALGTAMPSLEQSNFDLRRKQFAFQRHGLIIKQIVSAGIIIFITLMTIGIKGYIDIHKLSKEATFFEQSEINRIKAENIFTKEQFPKHASLAIVVREADKIIREKTEIWAPFEKARMHVLDLWSELTRIINKRQLDVSIKEVIFTTEEKNWERDKKDVGIPKIEVEGVFRSKTGDHYTTWSRTLENRFKESTLLKAIEIDPTPAPDGNGVNFSVKLKLKEV